VNFKYSCDRELTIDWHLHWYGFDELHIQGGPKVTSLVARSSRDRCAQHLLRIRECYARIRRESGAYVTQLMFAYDVRHVARVHHTNVARTCRARSAQQVMLLVDPSVVGEEVPP
jgi:hypothetical protein